MRVLVLTKIFPTSQRPADAPYNRLQIGALARRAEVEVLGLLPWFPGRGWVRQDDTAKIPAAERIDDLWVRHPRALYAPSIGRPLSGFLHAASLWPHVKAIGGRFDVVLGCFAYPDGFAAVLLARRLGVPAVVKVHGSDVNQLAADPLLRWSLRFTFRHAAGVVGPSQALVDRCIKLGASAATSRMIPNGVAQEGFHPRDRRACREALGHGDDEAPWIVFVGRIEAAKGVTELMEAFAEVQREEPQACLVLVGDGPMLAECRDRAARRGLNLRLPGAQARDRMPLWIGASQVVTLPSHAEGTPNVVLEALASGRRVVATAVGGIPDVVTSPVLGRLVLPGDADSLARALLDAIRRDDDPEAVAAQAPIISWDESGALLHEQLDAIVHARPIPSRPHEQAPR
ncbi:MAG: glycosyltransferase [Myxococcales bacterium]|nr:glycosyltransferase [Myxococcales bacterium]